MAITWTRRDFLALTGGAGAAFLFPTGAAGRRAGAWQRAGSGSADGWAQVPGILARVVPPTFPARDPRHYLPVVFTRWEGVELMNDSPLIYAFEERDIAVTGNFFYEEGDAGKFPPVVRDVEVRNVTSRRNQYGLLLRGYGHDPVSDVRVIDCTFDNVEKPDVLESVKDIALTNVKVNGAVRNERMIRWPGSRRATGGVRPCRA